MQKSSKEQIKKLEKLLEDTNPDDFNRKHKIRQKISAIKYADRFDGGYNSGITLGYVNKKVLDLSKNLVTLEIQEHIVEETTTELTIGEKIHHDVTLQLPSITEAIEVYKYITTAYTLTVFNKNSKMLLGFIYEDGMDGEY